MRALGDWPCSMESATIWFRFSTWFRSCAISAEPPPEAASVSSQHVVLRLRDGESLQVGSFEDTAEASRWAQEIVRQIASAEGQSTWPFFGNRYLRPDTIVSVDLVEESAEKWLGSSVRRSWAESQS